MDSELLCWYEIFLEGPILFGYPVMFLDRGHPRFWNVSVIWIVSFSLRVFQWRSRSTCSLMLDMVCNIYTIASKTHCNITFKYFKYEELYMTRLEYPQIPCKQRFCRLCKSTLLRRNLDCFWSWKPGTYRKPYQDPIENLVTYERTYERLFICAMISHSCYWLSFLTLMEIYSLVMKGKSYGRYLLSDT